MKLLKDGRTIQSIDDTAHQKMSKVGAIVAAMDRIYALWNSKNPKTTAEMYDALELQQLKQQRAAIMGTFPPIRKVVDNT